MKSKKKNIIMVVSIIMLFSILFVTVAAASLSEGGLSALWKTSADKNGVVKYEKPSIGDVAQDGAYPDEVKSNSSANAQEKEWYEYITYSKTPIDEILLGTKKYVFYDPYDYSYGMIMTISNPENDFGELYDGEEGYTTANSISVSYSKTKSFSWGLSESWDLGMESTMETGGAAALFGKVTVKVSSKLGFSGNQSWSNGSTASKTVSYNAIYFNSNGTPYRWRIVKYTVYLPLYCEEKTLVAGQWVTTGTNYCLLATVDGTCREWIDNVAYIEDWRTGEPVQVENFWNEFFSEKALIAAYVKQMLPKN